MDSASGGGAGSFGAGVGGSAPSTTGGAQPPDAPLPPGLWERIMEKLKGLNSKDAQQALKDITSTLKSFQNISDTASKSPIVQSLMQDAQKFKQQTGGHTKGYRPIPLGLTSISPEQAQAVLSSMGVGGPQR